MSKLYPNHSAYAAEIKAAAQEAEAAGVILAYQTQEYIRQADGAPIPG